MADVHLAGLRQAATNAALVVKMAKDDPSRGYDRIQGALKNIGHTVAPTTIRNILRRRGLEPAPLRKPKTTWKTFLKAHWSSLAGVHRGERLC